MRDLDRSLAFYTLVLGMTLFRRRNYPEAAFALAFLGYGREEDRAVVELTHNWGEYAYEHGPTFGHIALGVPDAYATCDAMRAAGAIVTRPAGPMQADPDEVIAFIEDPHGIRIELAQLPR